MRRRPSRGAADRILKQFDTGLRHLGLGVLQPSWLPPQQDPKQLPSQSGGADPFDTAQYTNFLGPQ